MWTNSCKSKKLAVVTRNFRVRIRTETKLVEEEVEKLMVHVTSLLCMFQVTADCLSCADQWQKFR